MSWRFPWQHSILPYPFYLKGRDDVIRIHITKTAGISLLYAMNFYRPKRKKGFKKHYAAKQVIDIIGLKKWESAFKFTFVRNPWDRLYSMYRYKLRNKRIPSEGEGYSFHSWLKEMITSLREDRFSNGRPQVDWLKDHDGKIGMDFIGRFENLDQDVQKLGELLQMKINLRHINQSLPVTSYHSAYDDELVELVSEHYREDIDTFHYSFL